jgi:hypothetical protein
MSDINVVRNPVSQGVLGHPNPTEQELVDLNRIKDADVERQGTPVMLDSEGFWAARVSSYNTIKFGKRLHSYRWTCIYFGFILAFILNVIYYSVFQTQYSLVLSSELNQCSRFHELYSYTTVNETAIYAPYIHNVGNQQIYDPQIFLTAQFFVSPPNNGIFLEDNQFFNNPSKNSTSYFFNPKGFFTPDNGSTDDSSVPYEQVILMSNFSSQIISYKSILNAPNNSEIILICSAGTSTSLNNHFEYYPIYTNANCSSFFDTNNPEAYKFNIIGILQTTSTGEIIANCQVNLCGTPFLYYTQSPSPIQIGIYKCLNKPNALAILSLSYSFSQGIYSFCFYGSLLLLGFKLLTSKDFWNFYRYEF